MITVAQVRDGSQCTPLHSAALTDAYDVAVRLLEVNSTPAQLNALDAVDATPLMLAAEEGSFSVLWPPCTPV